MPKSDNYFDQFEEAPKGKDSSYFDQFEEHKPEKSTKLEAGLEGFGQGASLGYLSQLQAVTEPAVFKALNAITGNDVKPDEYLAARDSYAKRGEKLKKDNPVIYGAGQLAGGIASNAPLSGLGQASVMGRIAAGTGVGAVTGALQNPGDVEGQYSGAQLGDRAKSALIGGGLGLGLSSLAEGTAEALNKGKGYLTDLSREQALKQAGASAKDIQNLRNKGLFNDTADTLFNEKIISPLATPKDIEARSAAKQAGLYSKVEDAINKADELGLTSNGGSADLKESIIKGIRDKFPGAPEEELAPAINKVETWFSNKPENMSAKDLQEMKKSVSSFLKETDYNAGQPAMGKTGLLATRRGVKEEIEKRGDLAAEALGQGSGQIKDANKKLGHLIELEDMASDQVGRDVKNRSISLTDTIAGAGGLAAGAAAPSDEVPGWAKGVLGAAATLGLNKATRTYGSSLAATGARSAANVLGKLQGLNLSGVAPKLAAAMGNSSAVVSALSGPLTKNAVIGSLSEKANAGGLEQSGEVSSKVADFFSKNPDSINSLQNPKLREQIKMQIDKRKLKQPIPAEQAQQEFIEGN